MPGKKITTKININKDDSSVNDFLYLWSEFESRPHKIFIHGDFSENILETFQNCEIVNNFKEISFQHDSDIYNDKTLIKVSDSIYFSYIVVDRMVNPSVTDLTIYYKSLDDSTVIENLVDGFQEFKMVEDEAQVSNLYIASLSQSGLEVRNVEVENKNTDWQSFYSKKTWKQSNKLLKKIKSGETGIVVLFGERGCGKSNYIKYLTSVVKRDIIFVPNTMTDLAINSPDFRKILSKFNKPIVVIDDCETLFNDFFTKSNLVCNNLIQLVDSVIPVQGLTIITLFNSKNEDEIDHNLLESNLILTSVEFTNLNKDEANHLSKTIGLKSKFQEECKLVDVFRGKSSDVKEKVGF